MIQAEETVCTPDPQLPLVDFLGATLITSAVILCAAFRWRSRKDI